MVPRRLRSLPALVAVLVAAASTGGIAAPSVAAAPSVPVLGALPPITAQASLGLQWASSSFAPGSTAHQYEIRVDDLTATTWQVLVVPAPTTAAPTVSAAAVVTDKHSYAVRVRADETICEGHHQEDCRVLSSVYGTEARTQVSLPPPTAGVASPAPPNPSTLAPAVPATLDPPAPTTAPAPGPVPPLSLTAAPRVPAPERPTLSRWVAPAPGFALNAQLPLRLRWRASEAASFYNVQVFVGQRKVLSAWPSTPSLVLLPGTLRSGAFRVVVWVASGPRAAPRFQPRPWLIQALRA